MPAIQLIGGEALEDLRRLEPLAEQIFASPGKRRQPGWFARKLWREGVVPELSALAMVEDGGSLRPQGYALLGRAPSLGSRARGAGVGLLPALRGRGLGRRLLAFAADRAHAAGLDSVEFLAEPERLPWYLGMGFEPDREEWTLLAEATGDAALAAPELQLELPRGEAPLWTWTPQCWDRTPAQQRGNLRLELREAPLELRAWFSREGQAILIHRVELDTPPGTPSAVIVAALDTLRAQWPAPTPLLLYPCPAGSTASAPPWIRALVAASWRVAQRSTVVRIRLDPDRLCALRSH